MGCAESKGLLTRQEIEAYRPNPQAAEEHEQWRRAYVARVLRVVHEELEAVERGETTPESYEAAV